MKTSAVPTSRAFFLRSAAAALTALAASSWTAPSWAQQQPFVSSLSEPVPAPPASAFAPGGPLDGVTPSEPSSLADLVKSSVMPGVAERLPAEPLVVDMEARGRAFGRHGGVWRMLINKAKRARYGVVYGYARLVGYTDSWRIEPDLLKDVEVKDGRTFVLTLRRGHKWSDGHPFTSAKTSDTGGKMSCKNPELSPERRAGDTADGSTSKGPTVIRSRTRPRSCTSWADRRTRLFLVNALAAARPPFIYRPAHYMRQLSMRSYADTDTLDCGDRSRRTPGAGRRSITAWTIMYKSDNPELPTLQPWFGCRYDQRRPPLRLETQPVLSTASIRARTCNCLIIDTIEMTVASSGLIRRQGERRRDRSASRPALSFANTAVLKRGEARAAAITRFLWRNGAASQIALYPNLNYADDDVARA